jgi:hypothetical protein
VLDHKVFLEKLKVREKSGLLPIFGGGIQNSEVRNKDLEKLYSGF